MPPDLQLSSKELSIGAPRQRVNEFHPGRYFMCPQFFVQVSTEGSNECGFFMDITGGFDERGQVFASVGIDIAANTRFLDLW